MEVKHMNRLSELRGSRSQAEFAKELGMSQQNYGYLENGKQGLKSDLIVKLCKQYGCTAEWLLCMDSAGEAVSDEADQGLSELVSIYSALDESARASLVDYARFINRDEK